jgi:Ion channel
MPFPKILRDLALGPNTEVIPTVGPKRACQLLRNEWDRPDSIGLVRLVRLTICVAIFLLPTIYIDLLVPSKSKAGIAVAREAYYVIVLAFLTTALFSQWHESIVVVALVIYLLADSLIHLGGQVFVWGGQSIDAARSLLLALLNYFEMTVGFAILYRFCNCVPKITSALDALYFSVITAATVGYGDITPADDSGKRLVILQILIAFLFVAVIITTLLGRATGPKPAGSSV